jgi:hypothetical protein
VIGGLISALFARQGSKELRREASDLRQLNYQLIRFLEDAGTIKNVEWKDGEPIRMVYVSATAGVRTRAAANPTVIRYDNNPETEAGH